MLIFEVRLVFIIVLNDENMYCKEGIKECQCLGDGVRLFQVVIYQYLNSDKWIKGCNDLLDCFVVIRLGVLFEVNWLIGQCLFDFLISIRRYNNDDQVN